MKLRNAQEPVLYLRDPEGPPRQMSRGMLDKIVQMKELRLQKTGDPEIETRIEQYEMAWCSICELCHPDWDHHSRLSSWCVARCRDTDQARAALVTDLKRRGLLDETLVVWAAS